jgi:hypothetical protein
MQAETRIAFEQSGNAIAAHIGQLEDRFERERLLSPPVR